MITSDLASLVREQVAAEVSVNVESKDRFTVSTPLRYSDGDHCGFVFVRGGDGVWKIVDEGEVLVHAGYTGVDLLGKGHADRFRKTAEFYGLHESEGELSLVITDEAGLGDAVFQFAQASLELAGLSRLPSERRKSKSNTFRKELKAIVSEFAPTAERHWHHPTLDPQGIHRADYRIPGPTSDLLIFGVNTEVSCLKATVSCLRYTQLELPFYGLAVYSNEQDVPADSAASLDEIVEKKFSLATEQEELEAFLRSHVAA